MENTGKIMLVPPEDLKPHPVNRKIYGDKVDKEFVESCKTGLVEPIVATSDLTIISGHRRASAANLLEWDLIPTVIREDLKDPLDIEEALILANRQREKTTEQKAREYTRLKEIAEARTHHGGRGNKKETSCCSNTTFTDRSDTKAAKAAGLGRSTAILAEKVVEKIDQAEADGKVDTAERLRSDLNTNVAKAHRSASTKAVSADPSPVPEILEDVFQTAPLFRGIVQRLGKLRADIFSMANEPGGERLPLSQLRTDINNVSEAIQASAPHAVCPYCSGTGCKECDALGWMHKDRYSGIPKERR